MTAFFGRARSVRGSFIIAIVLTGIAFGQSRAPRAEPIPAEWRNADTLLTVDADTGKVRFLGTTPGRSIVNTAVRDASGALRRATAIEGARGFLSRYGALFGLRNQSEDLTVWSEKAAAPGRSVVRFQQVRQGVPVVGGELVVQLNQDRDILSVHGEILPDIDVAAVPLVPLVDAATAQDLAREAVAKLYRIDPTALLVTDPELWVYHPSLLGPGAGITSLVWRMDVKPVELLPIRELVLIDAERGSLALRFNQVATIRNRETYTASNTTSLPGALVCNESNPTCVGGDSHAVSAHRYAADTYAFYFDNYCRDSLDDAGLTLTSTVHYGFNYFNAFWNGTQMAYGDACSFPLADDVVAHEFTHGVTDYESSFGPGVLSRSFIVPITNDTLDESDEAVNLALSSPTGGIVLGAQSTAILNITDNDTAGTLQFKSAAYTVSETGPTLTVIVTRTGGAASGVSVDYSSGGGSATAGLDYTAVSGTLSFGSGILSRTFTIPIANDTLDEINEQLNLTLSNPQGGATLGAQSTSVVTITDNDVAGSVQFSVAVQSGSELDSTATVTVTRTGGTASGVTVDYATSDGSATAGSDYTAASGTLSFGASEMSKTFTFTLLDDVTDEPNESIHLALSNPTGGVILSMQSTAVLFLVDNE